MNREIKAVLFDLGGTLFYEKDSWTSILPKADAALRQSLAEAGYPLSQDAYSGFQNLLDLYYHRRKGSLIEETTFQLLRDLLNHQGDSPPESVLMEALGDMYAVTQGNWEVEVDAAPTLQTLLDGGYRLGAVSNAADDGNVQDMIDMGQIRHYFEFIISSAACGFRKPHPHIFQLALDHFGLTPGRTVMVGDRLDADIQGANQMGIYSIWITRRAELPPEGELPDQPQAVISSLDGLPDLLEHLKKASP